jgi:hypothetical protein
MVDGGRMREERRSVEVEGGCGRNAAATRKLPWAALTGRRQHAPCANRNASGHHVRSALGPALTRGCRRTAVDRYCSQTPLRRLCPVAPTQQRPSVTTLARGNSPRAHGRRRTRREGDRRTRRPRSHPRRDPAPGRSCRPRGVRSRPSAPALRAQSCSGLQSGTLRWPTCKARERWGGSTGVSAHSASAKRLYRVLRASEIKPEVRTRRMQARRGRWTPPTHLWHSLVLAFSAVPRKPRLPLPSSNCPGREGKAPSMVGGALVGSC